MPLLAQPPTNPTAAGASRPLNTTHTVTASHYLLVSHRPPTLCSQLSPPASPAACCVARSARPAACCGALLRSAWPSPAPPAVLVGVGRRISTLSCSEAAQAARTEWRRGGSEGCHGHRSSRSAAAAARSPAVSRRTCTSESRVLVRCIVRARVHAPALMERPRQTPRRWSAPGPA